MTEPQPLDDLILLHVNDEALEMGSPGWAKHRTIYSLSVIAAWVEAQPPKKWTVIATCSFEIGTGYGDLPIYKLIVA